MASKSRGETTTVRPDWRWSDSISESGRNRLHADRWPRPRLSGSTEPSRRQRPAARRPWRTCRCHGRTARRRTDGCGHGAGHRDEPPDVTTGWSSYSSWSEASCGRRRVAESLLPDEPDVVERDELVDAVGLVLWSGRRPRWRSTPGCSLDTATPISAVAPVAARIAVRVKVRTRERARWRASGVLCSLGCRMGMHLLKSARAPPTLKTLCGPTVKVR